MGLPIVPLSTSLALPQEGVVLLGREVLVVDNVSKIPSTREFIKENFSITTFYVDFSSISPKDIEIDDIISVLDAGADKVICQADLVSALYSGGVPGLRLILAFPSATLQEIIHVVDRFDTEHYCGAFVTLDSFDDVSSSLLQRLAGKLSNALLFEGGGSHTLFIRMASLENNTTLSTSSQVRTIIRLPATLVVDHKDLTTERDFDPMKQPESETEPQLSPGDILADVIYTDRPDGLFTTLVVDEYNCALGIVYSSRQSIKEAIRTQTGVYQSRSRGLWYKGASSGATQTMLAIDLDCDGDVLKFIVHQAGPGFCHNRTKTCFGPDIGVTRLESTLENRLVNPIAGSYTQRLFNDEKLLTAKIMEEAEELTQANEKKDVAWEAADLVYFAMTKAVKSGVSWRDIETNLELKSKKVTRRKGDAKAKWLANNEPAAPVKKEEEEKETKEGKLVMERVDVSKCSASELKKYLTRPIQKTDEIMGLVNPIINDVRNRGDEALLELTYKFDKVKLNSPILRAPFDAKLYDIPIETRKAIDLSIDNVRKFHSAQLDQSKDLHIETTPGVKCSRVARPIEKVGLYIPGGTAVLPSTALMLGVPAQVAGCKEIIFASPPRSDGSITPEIVYVAEKVGASAIVIAGGAQAVAALAYGTESVPKVDKIFGPGNQFVTAAKMIIQNDSSSITSIDMPAGPSEVLVIADRTSNAAFVASDLLSQAEHGADSQVILIAVDLDIEQLKEIERQVERQALLLPRVDIVRQSLAHSFTLQVKDLDEAIKVSNKYAPEHLIIQASGASDAIRKIDNAGSVFIGPWSPESCGDYSSGTNHTLPTYGYAKVYSGVNSISFLKFITSQELSRQGLEKIGPSVMHLAAVEGLDAHRNAVKVRLQDD